MSNTNKYHFSFTAATMRLNDFMRLVESLDGHEDDVLITEIDQEEILSKGNERTSRREMQELLKRYNSLTKKQRATLYNPQVDVRRQITFVGMCKTYSFLRDFTIEVLREKVLVFDFQLTEGDLISFINRKKDLHPELDEFAESTLKKAKQHTFKILEEAGLINDMKEKIIQPQWLDAEVREAIINDNPELLKLFFMSDRDIQLAIGA